MGGGATVRRRGWTALIAAAVVELSVLGAVGIYGSVAGGRTFESGAFWSRALPSTSSPSPTSEPTTEAVEAVPVEVDACALVTAAEIDEQLGTKLHAEFALAGPGSDEGEWWTSCSFEEDATTARSVDITVSTGPDLDWYLPDYIDSAPLASSELPDDTARAIPGMGEEAWIVAEEFTEGAVVTLGVRTETAVVTLDFAMDKVRDVDTDLAVVASDVIFRLPAALKITPKRIGPACSAFELDGAAKFAGEELVGAREQKNPAGDVACGFAGVESVLRLRVLSAGTAAAERAFYKDTGQAVAGVGDEAYVYFAEIDDEFVVPYFYVRDGKRVFEVSYEVMDETLYEPRPKPTSAELALLRSLLEDGDVIGG